ncbi:MAG: endonuclease domain-containing protein [Anaerolineae bacterium]
MRANWLDGLRFRRQQIIDGFIVDFYCHAAGLVVEIDGSIHDDQIEYDAKRERILRARGLRILWFRNEEVLQDVENVLARIREVCQSDLTPSPWPPSPLRSGEGKGEAAAGGRGEVALEVEGHLP